MGGCRGARGAPPQEIRQESNRNSTRGPELLRNKHKQTDTEKFGQTDRPRQSQRQTEGRHGGAGEGTGGQRALRKDRPGREVVMDGAPINF